MYFFRDFLSRHDDNRIKYYYLIFVLIHNRTYWY